MYLNLIFHVFFALFLLVYPHRTLTAMSDLLCNEAHARHMGMPMALQQQAERMLLPSGDKGPGRPTMEPT